MPDKVNTRPDALVARRAAHQWGVLTLAELAACGLSRDAVSHRVQAGRLHPLYRGVYAVGHTNLPLEGRFLAAVKACGEHAVLSHLAAASLWGFVNWDDRYPTVTAPSARKHRGLRVYRSALEPQDVTRRKNIPVTTPARTLIDLSSVLPYKKLRRATREAHRLKLVTITELTNRLGRRRGTANLRRIIATGIPPTRSELEDAFLDLCAHGGLQPPQVNEPMILDGRTIIPDFRWPDQRLVVEADGAEWHDDRLAREDDVERQAILEAHGERVMRVTWAQTIRRRRQTLTRLTRAGAPKLNGP
jgi:very-short-patch-repair endonuclease/predicted transcriptional regulator of viral defense system